MLLLFSLCFQYFPSLFFCTLKLKTFLSAYILSSNQQLSSSHHSHTFLSNIIYCVISTTIFIYSAHYNLASIPPLYKNYYGWLILPNSMCIFSVLILSLGSTWHYSLLKCIPSLAFHSSIPPTLAVQ